MITTQLINFANYTIGVILSWLPDWGGFPSEVSDAFSLIGSYMGLLDPLIPIAAIAVCVGIIFMVELGIFGFRSGKWIISHVPFVGGRS